MKKYGLYLLFSSGLLLLASFASLQTAERIPAHELLAAYQSVEALEVVLHVKGYVKEPQSQKQKLMLSYQMSYRSEPQTGKLWYQMGNQTVLRNPRWAIQIDEQEKTMVYYRREEQKRKTAEQLSEEETPEQLAFANAMKDYVQQEDLFFTFLRKEGTLKVYQTKGMPAPIKKATFWMNEKGHLVKTHYRYFPNEYGQESEVEVSYEVFDPKARFMATTFSEKKYLLAKGKKIIPTKAYASYTLVDAASYQLPDID